LGPIDALHDAFTGRPARTTPARLPLVRMTGMKKVDTKTAHGTNTNFEPAFEIVRWLDKPPELTGGQPANEPKAEPVTQARTTTQAAPEPAPAGGNDF
jgi:hypothetical protein